MWARARGFDLSHVPPKARSCVGVRSRGFDRAGCHMLPILESSMDGHGMKIRKNLKRFASLKLLELSGAK